MGRQVLPGEEEPPQQASRAVGRNRALLLEAWGGRRETK